jgi:alcohol dehydrogenase (NADP+)
VKPEDAYRVLTTALDSGYRLFDCALLYQNESAIGDVLEKIFSQGKYRREEVFITTKVLRSTESIRECIFIAFFIVL